MPSRLHARRQMLKVLYGVTEVPAQAAGKKKNTKSVDWLQSYLMKLLQSMLTVTVVTPESLRSVSVRATELWK